MTGTTGMSIGTSGDGMSTMMETMTGMDGKKNISSPMVRSGN